jgi:hypothetical protein
MDPIGISLENFDAVGAWRTREPNGAVDPSGQLADGTEVSGIVSLRQALMRRPDMFATTLTEKLMTYRARPRTRRPRHAGVCAQWSRRRAPAYRFSSIVVGVRTSVPFQMRAAGDGREPGR